MSSATSQISSSDSVEHLIDGSRVVGDGARVPVMNPASGAMVRQLNDATDEQIAKAIAAARRTFDQGSWRNQSLLQRAETLRRVATLIRENCSLLAGFQMQENGMCEASVNGQIGGAAAWFDYYASYATTQTNQSYAQMADATTLVEREPMGVCALFTPWNVPLALSAIKLAPALAAGNSVVLKPSELTPKTVSTLVDLIVQAGVPDGVLNCVNGAGSTTGAALASAEGIDMVSFTGGAAGGLSIAAACAARHRPCVMELGGKSATIVFDDADLEHAVRCAAAAIYSSNGEACLAGSRILVHRSIQSRFLALFEEHASGMVIGDPASADTQLGPMVSEQHMMHVLSFYDSATTDNDTVLFGGKADYGDGYFVSPGAILINSRNSRVWGEEVFGPLAAISVFDTTEEAITQANDSDYGLAGYIFTSDITRALNVSKRLRTGSVMINSGFKREQNAPFGGYNQSGVGREGGDYSWYNFTEVKTTVISHPQTKET